MKNEIQAQSELSNKDMEALLVGGDLAKLNSDQRLRYYSAVCNSVGINPLTRPFDFISFRGKLSLYPNRNCAAQLRQIHRASFRKISTKVEGGILTVEGEITFPDGRVEQGSASLFVGGLKGEELANAHMKCETKCKRRVTLDGVGLGWLDESELETVPNQPPAQNVPAITIDPAEKSKKFTADLLSDIDRAKTKAELNGISQLIQEHRRAKNISDPDFKKLSDAGKLKAESLSKKNAKPDPDGPITSELQEEIIDCYRIEGAKPDYQTLEMDVHELTKGSKERISDLTVLEAKALLAKLTKSVAV